MNIGDIKKWSFGEMTSNTDGKSSVTSTSGFIIVMVGCLSFLLGVVDKMFIDNDADHMEMHSLAVYYERKFNQLWDTFETMVGEKQFK